MAVRRGWCPTLEQPMLAKDGWLVRVRPPLGRMTAAQARQLCDAADAFGAGRIELTSHANLQVRGVRDVDAFRDACGLRSPVGRVIVSPLAGDDPGVAEGTLALAGAVERQLAAEGAPHGKYAVVVDGGGVLSLAGVAADVHVAPAGASNEAGPRQTSIGLVAYPGGLAFGFGLPFGAIGTAQLRMLADLSALHADATLRLTPWRTILLGRVGEAIAAPPGLVADPASPLMHVSACVGLDGCAQASVATRAVATRYARPGLHVSGCAKGCAHPAAARLTLVGREGRYDVVRAGRAGDAPTRRGVLL